ncbi:MAG: VWA domain-containing protein, partial [Bacillota bacterium]|nr:VWA domain-containing protein [Bacillota bacterium]
MKNKNLRIIVLLLIIASFFNISFNKSETKNSTIFLVDRSLSVNNSKVEIEDFINEKIKTKTKNDFYSVISFGENINTDISFTNIEKELIFYDNIDNTQTDIVNAINIAIAKFPQDSNKQIVLITDGNNNSGNSINEIELDDIEIKILKLDKDMVKEVMVSDVLLPDNLSVNEQFNLEIKIESNIKTKGKLKVYNNRNLISEKIILIENGINNYVMKDKISKSGFVNYKIEVVPEIDTYISNNVFTINTEIFGNKNILIVNGESNESINMEMITSQMEVNSIMINASEVPITLSELNKYSTIILNDVSLENLNSLFINNLSIYVEKMGGGLLVTGGKNSFALGGYYKSKLEKILPVDMEMKIDGEVPDLSLLIIIDKSGSMSGIKLSSAKEAARLALDSLKIDDKIAIVSFDSVPTVELELVNHNEKDKVINSINGIAMGGGTSIIPALEKGYEIIKDSDTKLKHVILITDGMAEQRGYDSVLNEYSNENITITTIGIGRESDQRTLGMIAEDTDGRFYLVEDYHLITKIFSKETFLASKSYLNNEIFFPIATSNSEILRNITKLPSLNGYISSTIKPTATMILASENLEPILSTMRVGNGKTIAWCSDISGFWTSDFINTVEGQQVIKNALKYIFKDLNDNFLISEETNGNS